MKQNLDTFLNQLNSNIYESDLIELMLFYFYCDCLPSKFDRNYKLNMDKKTNQEFLIDENKLEYFINFISNYSELNNLKTLLDSYMSNFSFKLSKYNSYN